jgi:quercetin dioxygenase-like cupin family protein
MSSDVQSKPNQHNMAVLRSEGALITVVREGVRRKLIHGENLMMVVIDFDNGPWDEPEAPHHHPHEQTTFIAAGEIIFFCEGEPDQSLKAGDMFYVPGGKRHAIRLLTPTATLVDSFFPIRTDFL